MRLALVLIFLVVATPMAVSAHGADKMSVIVRGTRMDPDTVQMVQNDTVEFNSVNQSNRTVRMDFNNDGDYSDEHDFTCNLPSGAICALDRVLISIAILPMSEQFGYTDSTKGAIAAAFSVGYCVGLLPTGSELFMQVLNNIFKCVVSLEDS